MGQGPAGVGDEPKSFAPVKQQSPRARRSKGMHAVADQDFVKEFRAFRREMGERFDALEDKVGEPNSDRTGGTGLVGDVLALKTVVGVQSEDGSTGTGLAGQLGRTRSQVRQLINLKWAGTGIVAAVTVFGALLLLGVKQWIGEVVSAVRGGP